MSFCAKISSRFVRYCWWCIGGKCIKIVVAGKFLPFGSSSVPAVGIYLEHCTRWVAAWILISDKPGQCLFYCCLPSDLSLSQSLPARNKICFCCRWTWDHCWKSTGLVLNIEKIYLVVWDNSDHPCDRFTLMFNLLNEVALPQNSNLKVVGILTTAALISYFQ